MMTEGELRELDAKVHMVLYPNDRILGLALYDRPCACGFLPRYTTDIGAWGPVEALKPEWRWTEYDALPVNAATVMLLTERTVFSADVLESEAHGLAAYALGRARCVLAWANMNAVDEGDDRHEHGPTDQIGAE